MSKYTIWLIWDDREIEFDCMPLYSDDYIFRFFLGLLEKWGKPYGTASQCMRAHAIFGDALFYYDCLIEE